MKLFSCSPKVIGAVIGVALLAALPAIPAAGQATAGGSVAASTGTAGGLRDLAVTARPAGSLVALAPSVIVDTRSGNGGRGSVGARASIALQVLGRGGVPGSGVSAVALNVTAVSPTAAGSLAVFPDNTVVPPTANLSFATGQTVANLVIVPVGADGKVRVRNGGQSGSVHVVVAVSGYYTAGAATAAGTFRAITPARIVDSRIGRGVARAKVRAQSTVNVQIFGAGGLPTSYVGSVVVNVTSIASNAAGSITVYPTGSPKTGTPVVNFAARRSSTSLAVIPMWSSGKITLFNGSALPLDMVVDVVGYYVGGFSGQVGTFQSIPQQRVLDMPRSATILASRKTLSVPLAGLHGIPNAGMSAVAVDVTVVNPGYAGNLRAFGGGTSSAAPSLTFAPRTTVSNLVVVPIVNGRIQIYNDSGGPVALQVDIFGVFWDGSGAARCNAVPIDASGTAVTRWNPLVSCILAVLGQPQAAVNVTDVDTIIRYESSGDPNAINRYDINWQEGHPSEGLIQVIKPTFDAWRSPLLANNLLNPAANLYAGLNYAIHTYGSIHNVPGLVSLRGGGPYKGYIKSS